MLPATRAIVMPRPEMLLRADVWVCGPSATGVCVVLHDPYYYKGIEEPCVLKSKGHAELHCHLLALGELVQLLSGELAPHLGEMAPMAWI